VTSASCFGFHSLTTFFLVLCLILVILYVDDDALLSSKRCSSTCWFSSHHELDLFITWGVFIVTIITIIFASASMDCHPPHLLLLSAWKSIACGWSRLIRSERAWHCDRWSRIMPQEWAWHCDYWSLLMPPYWAWNCNRRSRLVSLERTWDVPPWDRAIVTSKT
jgi:hypothetical protein